MGQFQYHLDNIYNRRWQKFYFADGTYKDSRITHWLQVEWELVVKMVVKVRDFEYTILPGLGHRAFITYRSSGIEWVKDSPVMSSRPQGMRSWHVGYIDDTHAHVREIDFQTGLVKKHEKILLNKVESAIHPRIKQQWTRKWNPAAKDGRDKHVYQDQGHL